MESYVGELRKIIETMSYTENVADFYSSISQLENVSIADLKLVAPEAIKKSMSNPNSPLHSRDASPSPTRSISDSTANSYVNGYQNGYNHNSTDTGTDTEDEYIDTVEVSKKILNTIREVIMKLYFHRMKFPWCQLNTYHASVTENLTLLNTTAASTTRR